MKNVLLILILSFMCLFLQAQSDTVYIKVVKTNDNEIVSSIKKFVKKYNKDFIFVKSCDGNKIVVFNSFSGRYSAYAILVTLELEFVESEFSVVEKCKN